MHGKHHLRVKFVRLVDAGTAKHVQRARQRRRLLLRLGERLLQPIHLVLQPRRLCLQLQRQRRRVLVVLAALRSDVGPEAALQVK